MRVVLMKMGLVFSLLCTPLCLANTDIPCQVSAYYTPTSDQEDFDSAISMNGKGTHGADGTLVYEGMLSASKQYSFGSKIFIPGLGVGSVHDRGGSISGNIIDVWMGYGGEGKARALQWGRKNLTCTVAEDDTIDETLSFDAFFGDSDQNKKFKKLVEKGDKGKEVTKMQKFLLQEGFFEEEDFGYFGAKTEAAVFAFQKKYKIVNTLEDAGAGMWGPKTRKKANAILFKK